MNVVSREFFRSEHVPSIACHGMTTSPPCRTRETSTPAEDHEIWVPLFSPVMLGVADAACAMPVVASAM